MIIIFLKQFKINNIFDIIKRIYKYTCFIRILGFSFLENCNRHRHRFYCARFRTRLGQKLLTSHVKCCTFALSTEGRSVTD